MIAAEAISYTWAHAMAGTEHSSFAEFLKHCRIAAGLTQEELAQRARLSARAISALERGINRRPHKDTLRLLADALALAGEARSKFEAAARGTRDISVSPDRPMQSAPLIPLVGRHAELALLEEHLTGEGPPVLLLAGEPGIGKTRLLHEAARRGRARGMAVVIGGCQQRSGQQPHSPLLEALERYIGCQPRAALPVLFDNCAWLVRLLPELEEVISPPATEGNLAPEQERRLLFRAVVTFLSNVAGPEGTLLLLDDLQWAGSDALDLLISITSSADALPLRIVGAYRQTEISPDHPLSVAIGDLAERDLAREVMLGPLAEEEASGLLASVLESEMAFEPDAVRRIVDRSEGVPFFLVSSARALRAGVLDERLPWNVAESVRRRLAVLPSGAQEIAGVAAVIGRIVPRTLLLAVADQPDQHVVAALDALCRAGLLLEKGEQAYRFAHDVIREAVEADLGAARRTALHRRVAEALEGLPERTRGRRAPELAWHFAAGENPERALPYAILAGERAQAASACATAAKHYRMAAELARDLDDTQHEAEARKKLGTACQLQGRYDEALEALERAAQLYRQLGDRDREIHVVARIGWTHSRRSTPEEGIRRLEPALRSLEASGVDRAHPGSVAELALALSTLYMNTGRYEEEILLTQRATDLARALGDQRLLAQARGRHGLALMIMGRFEDAIQVLDEAIPLLEAVDDFEGLCLAFGNLAPSYHHGRGDVDKALECLEQSLRAAERAGNAVEIVSQLVGLGGTAGCAGHWAQQRKYYERALEATENLDVPELRAIPLINLANLCLHEGKWDEASRYLEASIASARQSQSFQPRGHVQWLMAARDLFQGRPESAVALLENLLKHPPFMDFEIDLIVMTLAWAHLEAGDICQAEQEIAACILKLTARSDRLILPQALAILGRVLIVQGRWDEAEHTLRDALEAARFVHHRHAEASALAAYGVLHARIGEVGVGREQLEEAAAIYRELGAQPFVHRTEQALQEL